MKRKLMAIVLLLVFTSQLGFAGSRLPVNQALGEKQAIFYQMTVDEIRAIENYDGMAYYPAEEAVYLREFEEAIPYSSNGIAVSTSGLLKDPRPVFMRNGFISDFEVEGQDGYLLHDIGGRFSIRNQYNNYLFFEYAFPNAARAASLKIQGNRMVVLEQNLDSGEISPFRVYALPEQMDFQDATLVQAFNYGTVAPYAFDLTPDAESLIVFGPVDYKGDYDISEDMETGTDLYLEGLRLPPESDQLIERAFPSGPSHDCLPIRIKGYEEDQALVVGDMYTTEDHIVVLFHEENQRRSFIQRYTYKGELVDQLETNEQTRRMTPGPDGSTLYLQVRYLEEDEWTGNLGAGDYQLEIIQMNWDQEAEVTSSSTTGRIRPTISERTFGGRTLARFADKGFGLIKQMEAETGIVDFRAPLRSWAKDLRLQIPYGDLMAKAGMGARDLVLTYQGQEIAIPFDLLLSVDLDQMPCQDDATIEIHLEADEEGNVTYTIELFVVEQVNGVTKVVHRKTIQ